MVCLLTPRLLGTHMARRLAPTLSPAPHPGTVLCDSGRLPLTQSTSQFTIASNMVKTGDILGTPTSPLQTQAWAALVVGRVVKGKCYFTLERIRIFTH